MKIVKLKQPEKSHINNAAHSFQQLPTAANFKTTIVFSITH